MFSNKVFDKKSLVVYRTSIYKAEMNRATTGAFLLSIGLHDIIVKLPWFEQLEVLLEYAKLDRELGWETKVSILYE